MLIPILRKVLAPVRRGQIYWRLPARARAEYHRDRRGLPARDPGAERAVKGAIAWLCCAQDHSASQDGGVARHFSLIHGWGPSYPETTGYIVPTLLAYANLRDDAALRQHAKRMLDWLVSIQFPSGAFQGGPIGAEPLVPVTFNTGQILLGLTSGVAEFGEVYRPAMNRAADWLVETQDPDGCWRKYPSPFVAPGEKAYDTHVAWGLLEAARLEPGKPYSDAALANVRWALRHQRENGWFANCCLADPAKPLTHTLGYVLRGLVEAYRFTLDSSLLEASCRTANGLLSAIREDGFLPGCLYSDWSPAVRWACLTGSSQLSGCWLLLYRFTGDPRYRDAALAVNRYVRRTLCLDGPPGIQGGVKGSFPVDGEYGSFQYLNWACKFFIDSILLEKEVCHQE